MRISDIPKTWRHTREGIWHQPRRELKWTNSNRKKKKFYNVWAIYYESKCIGCGNLCVLTRRKGFCTRECGLKKLKRFGKDHPRWNNGRAEIASGYVFIKTGYKKYTFEHRLVMEKQLGRKLESSEIVHHINGVKNDNRPENLIIMTRAQHAWEHHANRFKQMHKHS